MLSIQNKRISVRAVEKLVKKYSQLITPLKHITPHKLRSSAAMNLYTSNVGVLAIADLLGHENITTTQRYINAYEKEKENVVNILDNMI